MAAGTDLVQFGLILCEKSSTKQNSLAVQPLMILEQKYAEAVLCTRFYKKFQIHNSTFMFIFIIALFKDSFAFYLKSCLFSGCTFF